MAEPSPTLPPADHEAQLHEPAGPAPPAEAAARGDVAPARARWGSTLAALGLMMILTGIALLAFPFLVDFDSGAAAASSIASGGITAFLGALRLMGVRQAAIGYAAMLVGLWLFASSFFLGDLPREAWVPRSLGAIVFFLGMVGLARPAPDPAAETATSDPR